MKKITMQDLADKATVSLTTVSRYLNQSGYVARDKQALIEEAIKELGYKGAPVKKVVRQKTIGHILPRTETTLYFDRLSASLVNATNQQGYYPVLAQCPENEVSGEELLRQIERLCTYKVDGIVVAGISDAAMTDDVRQAIKALAVPVVFIERTVGCEGFDRIEIDTKAGMIEAVRYLLGEGHRSILYLDGYRASGKAPGMRKQGFLEAMEHFGGPDTQYWVESCKSFSMSDCLEKAEAALGEHPEITAIMAWGDMLASAALQALIRIGRRVPEEVEVVGYDDILAPLLAPPISSVHMPLQELANTAVQLIAEHEKAPLGGYVRTVLVEPKLVVRK